MDIPCGILDLDPAAYPVVIEYLTDCGELVHTTTITGPGVLTLPLSVAKYAPLRVRVTDALGGFAESVQGVRR